METDKPQEISPLTGTALSPLRKERKRRRKPSTLKEPVKRQPQAKGNPDHHQESMVSQESNGIASYQASSVPTATEPYYESVPCEPRSKVASQPVAEPAYESVETYWNEVKRKCKAPKNKMASENLYESIDQVAIQGQD
ncbi:hypothetical protein E2320_009487 [Naja naja]|nr:hypothetical protein E2320_009487 [Naja naja]